MISSDKYSIADKLHFTVVAQRLIQRGARVPVVTALVPLHAKEITALYMELNGRGSPKGPLPSHPNWYASALVPWRIVQCSLFVSFYKSVKATASPKTMEAEVLIGAYDLYSNHMESISTPAELTFDRAWHLMQMIRIKELAMVPCTKCTHEFVMHADSLTLGFVCSLCHRTTSLRANKFTQKRPKLPNKGTAVEVA